MIIKHDVQFKIKNENGIDWNYLYPISKANLIKMDSGIDVEAAINSLVNKIDELENATNPFNITSFTASISTAEKGAVLNNVVFKWSYNKEISSQSFDGESLPVQARSKTYTNSITSNRSFTIRGVYKGETKSKSCNISFYNGIYYGVSSSVDYNEDLIKRLTKTLSDSKRRTITVTANEGEYIYYCLPTRLGNCEFTVNGFSGGFDKVKSINFTNSNNYTESYDIYRSKNDNLGSTKVDIS